MQELNGMVVMLSVSQENSTDLGSQNLGKRPKAVKLQLKSDIFQFRKHCAEVCSAYVCVS
jgi:hypothetical protein